MDAHPRSRTLTELLSGVLMRRRADPDRPGWLPMAEQIKPRGRSRLSQDEQFDRAMLEDTLLDESLKLAHRYGWLVYHIRNSKAGIVQGDSGFPDLVLARDRVIYVELKNELGLLSPGQVRWRDTLNAAGQEWYLWRPSTWRTGVIENILR